MQNLFEFFRILVLLWSVNLAPVVAGYVLRERWKRPVDGGRVLADGHPVFGAHKTVRGVVAGVATGALLGTLLGFSLPVGIACGVLAMAGDLASSFIKRRRGKESGHVARGLDQGPEGTLPLLVLAPVRGLDPLTVLLILATFGVGAYYGSMFLHRVLLTEPCDFYPRTLLPVTRFREFRSCQVTDGLLHNLVNFEDAIYYHVILKGFFRVLGLYQRGKQNALRVVPREVEIPLRSLPEAFDGYRIMLLSDLHLDGLEGLADRIAEAVSRVEADLCVLAGDLRMETHGPWERALEEFSRIVPQIRARDGILAVLGNHDCIEMIQPLQLLGLRYLVNDAVPIRRNGQEIWIVGSDDPHYYRCHDLDSAFEGVPPGALSIFAAHSNEIYREAAGYGARLYLCGHTHGGQVRIPGMGAVFTHSSAPRRMVHGIWRHEEMIGYTTGGAGVSGAPVRFGCEGEVSVLRLVRARD